MHALRFYQTWIVPAAVFQAVIIGGGYGTGREVVEYLTRHGARGGLVAALAIAAGFALVLAVSFAFAQRFGVHDYRRFLRALLGRAWLAYEGLFLILLLIVLAVVGAAAGATAEQGFGLPAAGAVSAVLMLVVVLNFFGRKLVERVLSVWSAALMLALVVFSVAVLRSDGAAIGAAFGAPARLAPALLSGTQFAVYNSALVPVLVYSTRHITSTGTALGAGCVAGLCGALPALLLHVAFTARLDELAAQPLPTFYLLRTLGFERYAGLYFVLLFGTIVLTAVGILQGVNERLDGWRGDAGHAPLSRASHAAIAGVLVLASLLLARYGIIALVARGYGALSWAFFLVFTVPLLSIGIYKIRHSGARLT